MPPDLAIAPSTEAPQISINEPAGGEDQQAKPRVVKQENKYASKLDETLLRINEPTQDEVDDTKSTEDAIESGVTNASLSSKEANSSKEEVRPPTTAPTTDAEAAAKRKLRVGEQEYELDEGQRDRFAQKGIMYEKRNREIAKRDQDVQARAQQLEQREQQLSQTIQALQSGNLEVLEQIHGPQKARQLVENYLRPKIERELMPPEEQARLADKERADRAEAMLAERDERDKQAQISAQEKHYIQEYQNQIVEGLKLLDLPTGQDYGFLANEMASWMQRGLENKLDYTPQQLAQLVKQDNILRGKALTNNLAKQINAAKQANNPEAVVKFGEQLVEMLGDDVMYAIAKYHLAKVTPKAKIPGQILDTAKAPPAQAPKPSVKMTEDEYRAERKRRAALLDSGVDPGVWE